ncbi:MAG: endo alpha-1,4 polygalactosaminidase [Tepidisphaeraceae bacterium]
MARSQQVFATALAAILGSASLASAALQATGKDGVLKLTLDVTADQKDKPTQFLIDTDANPATGFSLGQLGADLMVEGERLYRFTGKTNAEWTWADAGTVSRTLGGTSVSVTVLGSALPKDNVAILGRVLSADYAQTLTQQPIAGPAKVTIERLQPGTERKGDCADASRDLTSITTKQVDGELDITLAVAQAKDFDTTLIFLDTDNNAGTGFQPPADPTHGVELLIQGTAVSKFAGKTRDAWAWEPIGEATSKVDGPTLHVRVPIGLLKSEKLTTRAFNMSADWQTLLDEAPDGPAVPVAIDQSKAAPVKAIPMAPPKANRDRPARERLRTAKNFYCYYGAGNVEALSHYDVVILHSPQMDRKDIARLKQQGVVTIGYISVGEDDQLRVGDGTGPDGKASWYFDLDHDNQPDKNGIWNSYFANTNDPKWRADRVAEVRRLITEDGYDGIFLDTIDTVQRYTDTVPGMVQLVRDFRTAFPDMPIVLNQGLDILDKTGPLADAVMLESFTVSYDFAEKKYIRNVPSSLDWHTVRVNRFLAPHLAKDPSFKVLILDYAAPTDIEAIQMSADRAASFGYLWAVAPIFLDKVYQYDVTPHPDAKWTQRQTTPEKLRMTFADALNGFTAGTVVTPSSCFGDYTVEPMLRPMENRGALHWTKQAWASGETGEPQWVEFALPQPIRAKTLQITWCIDGGVPHISRQYEVQVKQGDAWKTVEKVNDAKDVVMRHPLPEADINGIRIWQAEKGGSTARPDLMWIAQVRLEQ